MDDNFARVLKEFGASLGLDDLQMDQDGYCALRFDNVPVYIELLGDRQHVLLHTCLGQVPTLADKDFYARLLHGNHFFARTAGATIGVHPESGSIDMATVLEGERMSLEGFERALQVFVNTAEAWQRELGGDSSQVPDTSAAPAERPMDWASVRA